MWLNQKGTWKRGKRVIGRVHTYRFGQQKIISLQTKIRLFAYRFCSRFDNIFKFFPNIRHAKPGFHINWKRSQRELQFLFLVVKTNLCERSHS